MTWAEKSLNWKAIACEIQDLLAEINPHIPPERVQDIEHYLQHGELSSAFEYIVLEIIEREIQPLEATNFRILNLALALGLDNENEATIDGEFWIKVLRYFRKEEGSQK